MKQVNALGIFLVFIRFLLLFRVGIQKMDGNIHILAFPFI